jgi:glycosyltransferase involved in cell wall biosynthesis
MQTDGLPTDTPEDSELTSTLRHDSFAYTAINSHVPEVVLPILQSIVNSKEYDCIVAINVNAAAIVCRLETRLPVWADLMGHMMGEAQAKCASVNSDDLLAHFWQRQRTVLRRADRVSVSGFKQMYAVTGELGTLGRLGRHTVAHPFCTVIPIIADEQFLNMDMPYAEKYFRGTEFPEDTFAVLWTGGYNTWTDIKSLAAALTLAMEQVPRLRFVSTGGIIPGHDEKTYPAFQEEMRRSGFIDRCHFLGWIEGGLIPHLYAECDLGLNLDALNYETLLGGRNRLVNLMAAGVPVLTTIGTELSEIISENRLGYTVRIGKVQEYADALVRAVKIPLERRQLANRARTYVRQNFAGDHVTKPLLKWVVEPKLAPDNQEKIRLNPDIANLGSIILNPLDGDAKALESGALAEIESLRRENEKLQSEIMQLQGSRLFKLREQIQRIKKPNTSTAS